MVEVRALVIVEQGAVGLPRVELTRQLEHVVGVAMLTGRFREVQRHGVGLEEVFAVGIAADHVAVVLGHAFPEEARGAAGLVLAGQFVDAAEADQLRHLSVGVEVGELVLLRHDRIEHLLVVDALGHLQPAQVAGLGIEFGVALVEAAIFAAQQFLHLLVVERGEDLLEVPGEADDDLQRLGIAPGGIDVEQTLEILVHGVERRPRTVEVEPARLDLAAHDFGEDFLPVDDLAVLGLAAESADVAIGPLRLAFGQFIDDVVRAAAAFRVAGLLPREHQRSHVVAKGMAGDGVRFPAAVDRGLGFEPRIFAEVVQEAIGAEPHQVVDVDVHGRRIVGRRQTHVGQRQRLRLDRQLGSDNGRKALERDRANSQRRHASHPFAPIGLHFKTPIEYRIR